MNRKINSQPCNLLFITFDQLRGDWCDINAPVVGLPEIGKIAKSGWSATRCYTSSPHCVPARFSWITGLAPSQLGVTSNKAIDIPCDSPSIIRDLKNRGYQTNIIGKTHWTRHDKACDLRDKQYIIEAMGFDNIVEIAGPRALQRVNCELADEWDRAGLKNRQIEDLRSRYKDGISQNAWDVKESILPHELYPDCWITQKAIKRIQELPEDQPWLLWVSYVGPHEPFDTPRPWSGRHEQIIFGEPITCPGWINRLPDSCELKIAIKRWSGLLKKEHIKACQRDYADHLKLLDDQVGLLIDKINKRNDINRTAIALTSDHGELLGDAGMLYKGAFIESAINVPWIYKPPKDVQTNIGECYKKPIGLTELIKETIENLCLGGSIENIKRACEKQRGKAIVEFKDEKLLIDNDIKLCVNKDGEALWGIDIKNDPEEQVNILEKCRFNAIKRLRIKLIKIKAKRVAKQRSSKSWIWRQL